MRVVVSVIVGVEGLCLISRVKKKRRKYRIITKILMVSRESKRRKDRMSSTRKGGDTFNEMEIDM